MSFVTSINLDYYFFCFMVLLLLQAHWSAYEGNDMSLKDKLSKAAGVLGRITAKAEARADSVIERETVLEKRIEEAFSPHEALLKDTEKGLDDVERQLALVSNGAPLPESSDTTKLDNKGTPHPGLTRG
jgi:hypothetical protein